MSNVSVSSSWVDEVQAEVVQLRARVANQEQGAEHLRGLLAHARAETEKLKTALEQMTWFHRGAVRFAQEMKGRAEAFEARCAQLSAAGRVLSEHADRTAGAAPDGGALAEVEGVAAYDEGAEAMRAACGAAAQRILESFGFADTGMARELKAAIEGAAP